jgi:hypothetical protein
MESKSSIIIRSLLQCRQSLPSDLISFFKEELAGETINYVSLSAQSKGVTKLEALQILADETAQCYIRASRLLEPYPEAWKAFRAFCVGYIGYHVQTPRYKLDQLQL